MKIIRTIVLTLVAILFFSVRVSAGGGYTMPTIYGSNGDGTVYPGASLTFKLSDLQAIDSESLKVRLAPG